MFQKRCADKRDITKCQSTERRHDRPPRSRFGLYFGFEVIEVRVRDQRELFLVIPRIELLLDDRILSNNGVKEKSIFWHSPGRRGCQIAFRINERVTTWRFGDLEILRHEDLKAIIHPPWPPVFVSETEHGFRRDHSLAIN